MTQEEINQEIRLLITKTCGEIEAVGRKRKWTDNDRKTRIMECQRRLKALRACIK